jgi:hypothetical protein
MKTYKIQVFRKEDNKQIYGLHADDSNREERLAEAMKLHTPPKTKLVNKDITKEMSDKKEKKKKRKQKLKDKTAKLEDRFDALVEHFGLDI